jgi:hypothetical protein
MESSVDARAEERESRALRTRIPQSFGGLVTIP